MSRWRPSNASAIQSSLFAALMVTDIIRRGTELLCARVRHRGPSTRAKDSDMNLPGVMSRKKSR